MSDLRAAAQQALEALEKPNAGLVPHNGEWMSIQSIAITALRAALAEPVQEPVAWWIPKAEQFCIAKRGERPFAKAWQPLYPAPPQRKPLTEEEIWALYYALPSDDFERSDRIDFARAIERAHGIGGSNE